MNATDFVMTVRKMRAAQKRYFTEGRKQSDLFEAKRLEKIVDQALDEGVTVLEFHTPTEPTMDEAIQLGLLNDEELANMGIQRPTDEEGEQPS